MALMALMALIAFDGTDGIDGIDASTQTNRGTTQVICSGRKTIGAETDSRSITNQLPDAGNYEVYPRNNSNPKECAAKAVVMACILLTRQSANSGGPEAPSSTNAYLSS